MYTIIYLYLCTIILTYIVMVISVREFRANLKKYFEIAEYEEVFVNRGNGKCVVVKPAPTHKEDAVISKEGIQKLLLEIGNIENDDEYAEILWNEVEDCFNYLNTGKECNLESEKSMRLVKAYSYLIPIPCHVTKENFRVIKDKLVSIANRTYKYEVGSRVSFTFNGRKFTGKITGVEWLLGRGYVYEVEEDRDPENPWDQIPESNILEQIPR